MLLLVDVDAGVDVGTVVGVDGVVGISICWCWCCCLLLLVLALLFMPFSLWYEC